MCWWFSYTVSYSMSILNSIEVRASEPYYGKAIYERYSSVCSAFHPFSNRIFVYIYSAIHSMRMTEDFQSTHIIFISSQKKEKKIHIIFLKKQHQSIFYSFIYLFELIKNKSDIFKVNKICLKGDWKCFRNLFGIYLFFCWFINTFTVQNIQNLSLIFCNNFILKWK